MANYDQATARVTAIFSRQGRPGALETLLVPAKFRLTRYNVDGTSADKVDQLIETLPGAEQGFGVLTPAGEEHAPIEKIEIVDRLPFADVMRVD